jgi:hypothetical protein
MAKSTSGNSSAEWSAAPALDFSNPGPEQVRGQDEFALGTHKTRGSSLSCIGASRIPTASADP